MNTAGAAASQQARSRIILYSPSMSTDLKMRVAWAMELKIIQSQDENSNGCDEGGRWEEERREKPDGIDGKERGGKDCYN